METVGFVWYYILSNGFEGRHFKIKEVNCLEKATSASKRIKHFQNSDEHTQKGLFICLILGCKF